MPLFLLGGCAQDGGNLKTVVRGGLRYQADGKTPFTGAIVETYENGQKSLEEIFQDGKREGKVTSWYENGQLEVEINYQDGKHAGMKTSMLA